MIRELQTITGKNAAANYTADVAMVRGMVVIKSGTEAILPTSAGIGDLFFVDKQFIPTGLLSLQGEISDYSDSADKITANEAVILTKYLLGERVATDQVTGNPVAEGTYLIAGTDGKLKAQTASTTSTMISRGTYDDAGHTLTIVEIVEPNVVGA